VLLIHSFGEIDVIAGFFVILVLLLKIIVTKLLDE